ncbi:MAG: hypothetical protein Q7T56_20430 [Nocardioidaceae bacterium]|nr:hypothetical protein [Nocardioidaceae bacterium]
MRPSTSVWQRPAARATRAVAGAFLATASLVVLPGLGASSASATATAGICGPSGTLFVNDVAGKLHVFSVSNGVLTEAPSGSVGDAKVGDVAKDGTGALFGLDTATGKVQEVKEAGAPVDVAAGGSLDAVVHRAGVAGLPGDKLLVGDADTRDLHLVNLVAGTSSKDGRMLPADTTAAGDFVQLSDGTLYALVKALSGTAIARIHPSDPSQSVVLGTVAGAIGLTAVDDKLYVAGSDLDGTISRLNTIPATATGGALTLEVVGQTGEANLGAASDQEALSCGPASLDVVPTKGSAGGSVPVTGAGWPASADVSFGFTDSTAKTVGTPVVVKSDASGNLPTGSTITLPAGAEAGVLTVTASGVGRTAADSLEVVAVAVDAPETTVSGSTIDLTSTGFAAQPVTVTLTDSGGTVTTATVTPAADGRLSAVKVPAAAKTGSMAVTASQGSLTATDTTTVEAAAAALTLAVDPGVVTDVNSSGTTDVGDTIDYTFTVTGSGNVPVTGVTVTAASLSADPIACTPSDVPPKGTATCGPVTHTVTDADAEAGLVTVGATASGTGPDGTVVTTSEMVSGATTIEPVASVPEESVPGDPTEEADPTVASPAAGTPTDTGVTETSTGTTTTPTETTTTSSGTLPNTGGLDWYWAVLGAASFGAGAVLLRPTRRRRPPAGMI